MITKVPYSASMLDYLSFEFLAFGDLSVWNTPISYRLELYYRIFSEDIEHFIEIFIS